MTSDNIKYSTKWRGVHTMILEKNWGKKVPSQIAEEVGFSLNIVMTKATRLGLSSKERCWSKKEVLLLRKKWGVVAFPELVLILGRTPDDITNKVKVLSLIEAEYIDGEYITVLDAANMLGVSRSVFNRWQKYYGLKTIKKNLSGVTKSFIQFEHFLEWLKENPKRWDGSKVDKYALGIQPKWFLNKIEEDIRKNKE